MKGFFRGLIQHSLAWSFNAIYVPWVILIALITFGKCPDSVYRPIIRFWGRMMLRFSGVTLDIDESVKDLEQRRSRVVIYNHSSTLDIFIVTALLPLGGMPVIKREFIYIPFMGWGVYFLGFIRVDRKNRERAVESLQNAGKRIRDDDFTAVIAPEGTRTKDGKLGAFKLGAFRMAEYSGAPIVPMVIEGASDLWPTTSHYCKSGVVKVRLLPDIESTEISPDNVREFAQGVRQQYQKSLGEIVDDNASQAA